LIGEELNTHEPLIQSVLDFDLNALTTDQLETLIMYADISDSEKLN
jgi:hypothetical protein